MQKLLVALSPIIVGYCVMTALTPSTEQYIQNLPEERKTLVKQAGVDTGSPQQPFTSPKSITAPPTTTERTLARKYPSNLRRGGDDMNTRDTGDANLGRSQSSATKDRSKMSQSELFGVMLQQNLNSNRPAWDVRPIQ